MSHGSSSNANLTCFRQDTEGDKFFVVLSGEVVLEAKDPETGAMLSHVTVKSGECFGAEGLQLNNRRPVTAMVPESCELMLLYRRDYRKLVQGESTEVGSYCSRHTLPFHVAVTHHRDSLGS